MLDNLKLSNIKVKQNRKNNSIKKRNSTIKNYYHPLNKNLNTKRKKSSGLNSSLRTRSIIENNHYKNKISGILKLKSNGYPNAQNLVNSFYKKNAINTNMMTVTLNSEILKCLKNTFVFKKSIES